MLLWGPMKFCQHHGTMLSSLPDESIQSDESIHHLVRRTAVREPGISWHYEGMIEELLLKPSSITTLWY